MARLDPATSPWQWQLVQAHLDPVRGSEQAGLRPVLIVSREVANRALPVVVALPVTTRRVGRPIHVSEVLLPALAAGQPSESVVMTQQVRTIAKERITFSYGILSDEALRSQVRAVLRLHLDLEDASPLS